MLDLDHNLWRKPTNQSFDDQAAKASQFKEMWKPYDWTERVKQRMKDNEGDD